MILFLVLMGIMGGGYHPAAPPMIVASVKPEKRGSALGLHLIGGSASYFLAPIIAAAIAATWGWRGSFIGLAVPAMIFGVIFYLIMGRIESAEGKNEKPVIADPEGLSKPGRVRRLVIIIILSTFLNTVLFSVASFVPLFLVDHFGIAEGKAAAAMAFMYSAGLWASPLGGYLSDRLGRVPIILAICLCAGPAIYMFNVATGSIGVYVVLIIIGIIYFIRMPVSESYIVGKTSVKNRSTILGIYFFSGMEGGGVLTPVMGFLIDRYGFQNSFTAAAAVMLLVTLICAFFLRNDRG